MLRSSGKPNKVAKRGCEGHAALSLANEAINRLRSVAPHVLASYFIGAVPFVLGLLFFWSDMSRSAFAHQRCLPASLGLVLLFVWMKVWQVVFLRGIREELTGHPLPPLTRSSLMRALGAQLMIQPYGLLAIPLSMAIGLPFFCVYGYYQNVTALGDGSHVSLRSLSRRAWKQARLWPRQSYGLLWLFCPWVLALGMLLTFGVTRMLLIHSPEMPELNSMFWFIAAMVMMYYFVLPLCPFGCIVAGNIAVTLVVIPGLMHSLLGIDTAFTLSGWHGIFNTTFLVTVYGISFLCLDPLMKTMFALRCYYGEARQSGQDLRGELRELRRQDANGEAAPS